MPLFQHHRLFIGVPVFNESRFLRQCLESLAVQTDQDFAVLVSDNSSTDGSDLIAEEFSKEYPNFFFIQQQKNIGAAKNFIYLLDNTDSPFFQWLGSHDFLDKDFIGTILAEFDRRPSASLVYSHTQWIDEDGRHVRVSNGGNFASSECVSPLMRYIETVSGPWGECTAVNGIFKRDAIKGTQPHTFRGPDHLILSRAQFFGPVSRVASPLYFRREFRKRETTQLERLKGDGNAGKSGVNSIIPLIFWQLKNFLSLPCGAWSKFRKIPLLLAALERGHFAYFPKYKRLRRRLNLTLNYLRNV